MSVKIEITKNPFSDHLKKDVVEFEKESIGEEEEEDGQGNNNNYISRFFWPCKESRDDFLISVRNKSGKLIGVAWINNGYEKLELYVTFIIVHKMFRRQGVCRTMINKLVELNKDICLTCEDHFVTIYEKLGFVVENFTGLNDMRLSSS